MTEYIMQPTDTHQWVHDNVMTTPEAIEILGVSRSRMSNMIKNGKIVPIKKLGCVSLFLKSDLEKKKEELIVLRKKYQPNA
ncbi:helix-turn-helix domain-containing protein [Bacillus cereus]|uniref:helix-turn-helix domain-containing protein n=1 Tax=Bacillus cereus group TaxID=86661 RepID=UPI000BFA44B9|nr:helix-turn-helix domain-containing protein [Bacillus cereus group sp. Bc015]MDA2738628.1 helix-turn-helix domain-containing protein [Bacillus cereus group sp. Bc015]PFD82693.1 DNA-binding protein [Bacillus anthracis]